MKKTWMYRTLAIMLCVVAILSCIIMPAAAASYPHVYLSTESQNAAFYEGDIVWLEFTYLPEYHNERIYVDFYDSDGNLVATSEEQHYNSDYGSYIKTHIVTWKTEGCSAGTYKIVTRTEFYSFYSWNESPTTRSYYIELRDRSTKPSWGYENGNWVFYIGNVKQTNRWAQDSVGWCYLDANGYMVKDTWLKDGNGWCYIDAGGHAVTNQWVKDSVGWCYLNSNGNMVVSQWAEDSVGWCYLDAGGHMVKDKWVKDSNGWCYIDAGGHMVTNKWIKDSAGWCYLTSNGNMAVNQWAKDSAGWCYLGSNGYIVKNQWVQDKYGWCCVDANGYMLTNKWIKDSIGWCYLGSNGYVAKNEWAKDSVGWCYLDENGRITTGKWIEDSVGWCYLDETGRITTSKWVKDSNGWCYLDAGGHMVTNKWIKDSAGWCYLTSSGNMAVNQWAKDSNGWCYMGANGYMVTGWVQDAENWYYLDGNGYMVTGWRAVGDNWYYFDGSGKMAADAWQQDSSGWCYLGSDGALVNGAWADCNYCWHSFKEATYTVPATCIYCGETSGKAKDIPISIEGTAPYYATYSRWGYLYDYSTQAQFSNFSFSITENANGEATRLTMDYDIEKVYDSTGVDSDASVKGEINLYDANNKLIDSNDVYGFNLYVGDKLCGESTSFDLSYWDGETPFKIVISNTIS